MILLSLVLVLASAGLLIAGLSTGDHHLIWGSMVASVLAAGALAVAVFRRRPAAQADIPADVPVDGPIDVPGDVRVDVPVDVPIDVPADAGAVSPDAGRIEKNGLPDQDAEKAGSEQRLQAPPPEHPAPPADEPGIEEASSTDVLRILDLIDEVMVVDERPRYHLAGCPHLSGRSAQPLPISEARDAGFTPCALCRPDSNLADRARGGSA